MISLRPIHRARAEPYRDRNKSDELMHKRERLLQDFAGLRHKMAHTRDTGARERRLHDENNRLNRELAEASRENFSLRQIISLHRRRRSPSQPLSPSSKLHRCSDGWAEDNHWC